jgi:hypothetical protein
MMQRTLYEWRCRLSRRLHGYRCRRCGGPSDYATLHGVCGDCYTASHKAFLAKIADYVDRTQTEIARLNGIIRVMQVEQRMPVEQRPAPPL